MRVLFTGKGNSGSWKIRGEQMAHATGFDAAPKETNFAGYDVVVLVKRPTDQILASAFLNKCKLVWDIVDSYPQPHGNHWGRAQCMEWLDSSIEIIKPDAIVTATKSMAMDCDRYCVPVVYLPHHARPKMRRNPIREKVTRVGYEGGEQYIQKWWPILERECAKRGWSFVSNPDELANVDIVVALRDQFGYAPSRWKSNVKLANAQGSGTPCIINREQGYIETASGAELWVDSHDELGAALDTLTSYENRLARSEVLHAKAPHLKQIAKEYKAWLGAIA